MLKHFLLAVLCSLLTVVTAANVAEKNGKTQYPYIITAEQFSTSFIVINPNVDPLSEAAIVWRYDPLQDWNIDDKYARYFTNPSEAKIVNNGTKLLLTSSGGICALVDLKKCASDWVVFPEGNTHSAEILSDGNLLTASSASGGYLTLYDLKKDRKGSIYKKYVLRRAHTIVFDPKDKLLYVAWKEGIISYKYDPEKVELKEIRKYNLNRPDLTANTHDLIIDPVDGKLIMSLTRGLIKLDQATGKFELIHPQRHIKSISADPKHGLLLTFPDTYKIWWNDKLHILGADGKIKQFFRMPHMRFYKARWIPDNENFWLKNKTQ